VEANYTITYVPGTMTVTPVPLTATASNVSRNSGEVNPTLTGTLVGVRNGDQVTAAFVTTATTTSPPGTYTITPAGGSRSRAGELHDNVGEWVIDRQPEYDHGEHVGHAQPGRPKWKHDV